MFVGFIASITLLGRLIVNLPPKEFPVVSKSTSKVELAGMTVMFVSWPPSIVYDIGNTWLPILILKNLGAVEEGEEVGEEGGELVSKGFARLTGLSA